MTREQLMPTFVRDDRFQREVLWIRITLKGLGVDCEKIMLFRTGQAVLGAPSETVEVLVSDLAHKSQLGSDFFHPPPARLSNPNRDRRRLALGHSSSLGRSAFARKRNGPAQRPRGAIGAEKRILYQKRLVLGLIEETVFGT